ncbi:MAG: FAD-binding oxidoreductase [archaeon]
MARLQNFTVARVKRETKTCKTLFLVPERRINFLPGQFLNLYLPANGKPLGLCRSYTIASPPGEREIQVTFRLKGEFTELLWKIKKGGRIAGIGPLGKFVFDGKKFAGKKVVFIAGGIGSAGFTSAIRAIAREKFPIGATTFVYSERDYEDVPFLPELKKMKKLRLFTTLTGKTGRGYRGPTGRLDSEKLSAAILPEEAERGFFFVCGSDIFVKDIVAILSKKMKISKKRIFFEGFG